MSAPPLPFNETKRLRSVVALGVLDSEPEHEFDALVRAAALACNVPISLIGLVDANRVWFKANIGLPGASENPREVALCAHAILEHDLFEVTDTRCDPRFEHNALVTGEPRIRFYASATLRLSDGTHAGSLCVIDHQPRQLSAQQREVLSHLAAAAVQALESRRDMHEQLRAAQGLVDSEARFKALSETSPLGVFATDAQGACTYTNAQWQAIYGLTLSQSLGNGWTTTLDPADRAAVIAQWERAAGSGAGLDMEFRIRHADGQTRTVQARARAHLASDGTLAGYAGTVEDVTEQRALSAQLSANKQRLRQLYESTPAMLHSIDPQGCLLTVTGYWLDTLGYTREEVIGRHVSDFFTPASRDFAHSVRPQFFAQGRCDNVAYQMVRKNGDVIDVLLSTVLERDTQGQPLRGISVVRDVTEQLRAEHALRDERVRLGSIIKGTGTATWEWNVQTGEMRFNERWADIIGYTLAELVPVSIQTWRHHSHQDDVKHAGALLDQHLAGALPSYECEVRMRHRSGHWVWVMTRGRVLTRTPDGKPEWMFGTHVDITARKQQDEALRKSEQLLNRTGKVAGVGGWVLDLLTSEVWWSAQTRRIHGVAPDYVPVLSEGINFYTPEARPVITQAIEQAIATGKGWDLELQVTQASGQRIWVRTVGEAEFDGDTPVRLVGAFQDITVVHGLNAQLAEQHELLRVTLQSIGDAVITTDASGTVTWLNPVAERMTGWLNAQAKGHLVDQIFHIINEETRARAECPVASCLQRGAVAGLAERTALISRTGQEFGIEDSASPIRSELGDLLGAVLVFHDVTEQRRLSGEMSYRATHDALTGLVNRAEFEARLRRVLNNAREEGTEHALLFIDLDQFKLVNDACGHSVGDQLLQRVSKLLGDTVRARDTLARMGGDEFAVILEQCSADQAQRVAQQICDRMDDFRFMHDDRRFRIGTSIGLVPVDKRWGTTAAIIQAADTSCYAAKEAGRNRVHTWFDSDIAMRARHGETQWAARIEQALDEDRFALHAQRIEVIDGPDGRGETVRGLHAEVLIRMIDSDGSVVQPGAFLPAAERFHFASRIDRWVLRHAIDALRALANLSTVDTLCVNLSGQSVGDRAFHRQAIETLTDAGAAICACLCLEITETAAVTNMADASVFIDQVRALGVRIALDDFGAGASSFGYLKNLNVDLIKIDGQFIRDLLDDPLDDVAVRCFVEVARVVGVKTVAEFVDRVEVLDRVRAIGIDFAQGYFLHRPEPIEKVLGLHPAQA